MSQYYYQNRNGRRVRVRKGMKASLKRDIKAGTTSAASSAGFVLGTGAGVSVARVISKNPVLKTVAMSLGAIAGATAGNIVANRILYRKKIDGDYSQSKSDRANFATEDSTYTRRSPKGKLVVVRKSKNRRLSQGLQTGFVLGVGALGAATGNTMSNQIKRMWLNKNNLAHKIANPAIKTGLIAAGTGVGLVTGVLYNQDIKNLIAKSDR